MPGHAELVGDESASISSFSHNLDLLLKHLAAISDTHITPSMGPVLPGTFLPKLRCLTLFVKLKSEVANGWTSVHFLPHLTGQM